MKTVHSHILVLCCILILTVPFSVAYAQKSSHLQELEELLELYPEEPKQSQQQQTVRKLRPVFSELTHQKITEVDATAPYKVVGKKDRWLLVRFDNPIVPGWVDDRYIQRQNDSAVVTVNALAVRVQPVESALAIANVQAAYRSPVLDTRNGFSQILLSADSTVAILDDSKVETIPNTKQLSRPETTSAVDARTASTSANGPRIENPTQGQRSIQERQHLISPGDAISLLVFGEPDLSIENVRVPESGQVSFPLIGSVSVGGQTTRKVEELLRDTLSEGYVKNPRLSVTIFSYRPIFIRGGVRSTGAFPYTEGLSVAKAIALAGGSKNSAKVNGVSILRDGETIETGLALDSQQKVASGDVITIAEEVGVGDDATLFIYLHGEVANPGEYLYRRGLTVEKAIVLAGGFTLRASSKKIKVTRYAEQSEDDQPTKLKGVKLYTPVEPGDVIKIGARWF